MAGATARVERKRRAAGAVSRARASHDSGPASSAEPTARGRVRGAGRPRVRGGVAWIVIVGVLLAGIVALNVAVLRLNVQGDRLDAEIKKLETTNSELVSDLSSASASGRIQAGASQLGLVAPTETEYLRLRPEKR